MKFANDNLIIVVLTENEAGGRRKAAPALALRGLVKKIEKKLKIRIWDNLIISAASKCDVLLAFQN